MEIKPEKLTYNEEGVLGLREVEGWIYEAYNSKLYWPAAHAEYDRIIRSDPEVTVIRQVFTSLCRSIDIRVEPPDNATDADRKAAEFIASVFAEMEGGLSDWLESCISNAPFFGWAWWEGVYGLRKAGWRAEDGWQSQSTDGLIGLRKLAFRDPSSFWKWEFDDKHQRLLGMHQRHPVDMREIFLPLDRSLHVTFGDRNNPEGLSPLEAIWRLERLKYGFEVVQGIGFEHAAGYLKIEVADQLPPDGEDKLKRAAKNLLTAQEGNYGVFPKGVNADIIDTTFQAAGDLLNVIKYYSILKYMVYFMQWLAMSTLSSQGSYSALDTSTDFFISFYNSMIEGFVAQLDDQIVGRLMRINAGSFQGITKRPHLKASPVTKSVALDKLGAFFNSIWGRLPLGPADLVAIRKQSGILTDTLPSEDDVVEAQPKAAGQVDAQHSPDCGCIVDMAKRPVVLDEDEEPTDTDPGESIITEKDVNRALRKFRTWAKRNDPGLTRLLDAKVEQE
jgi:hypothetical protein